MKQKKSLKKLDLSKEKISALTPAEAKNVSGGFFGSRFICTQSNAEVGCTSHTRCGGSNDQDQSDVTILCID